MKQMTTIAALAVLAVGAGVQAAEAASARREPGGAVRFYDENGNDPGYAWCRQRGSWGSMLPPDCSYYTFGQCQAAAVPFGNYCIRNPYAAQAAQPRRRR